MKSLVNAHGSFESELIIKHDIYTIPQKFKDHVDERVQ